MGTCETFTIGPVRLILGDASDLARDHEGAADLIVSDPPYLLTSGGRAKPVAGTGRSHKIMRGVFCPQTYDNSGALMEVPGWDEIARVMSVISRKDCDAYVMGNAKNVFLCHPAMIAAGWKFHNLLPWDKVFATPNRYYMQHFEFALYMWKGKARTLNDCGQKQGHTERPPRKGPGKVHDTQKPVNLLRRWVANSSDPGDLVIDPYAGSGSALIAAAAEGRRAIGFEKSEKNFRNACRLLTLASKNRWLIPES